MSPPPIRGLARRDRPVASSEPNPARGPHAEPSPSRAQRGQQDVFEAPPRVQPKRASLDPASVDPEKALRESIGIRGHGARMPTYEELAEIGADRALFSRTALAELESLPDQSAEFARRERVQGVQLTIDSYSSNDLDNALSYRLEPDGTEVVGVHAVDLSAWIRMGSSLDHAARRRYETRYLENVGLVLPMIPLSLCEGKLSLFEGQPRLTKSLELRFPPSGEPPEGRLFRSVLVNGHRLDEADAQRAREGGGRAQAHPELQTALERLCALAARLRGQTGDATLNVTRMLETFSTHSTLYLGDLLAAAGVETSYRVQPEKNKAASYAPLPLPHASMGEAGIAKWLGPMRRYADLDVHRALDRYLEGRSLGGKKQEIDRRVRAIQHARTNGHEPGPFPPLRELIAATRKVG